jgi:hypothetical protein
MAFTNFGIENLINLIKIHKDGPTSSSAAATNRHPAAYAGWIPSGVWESLFKTLADDPDNEYAMIDATIVRAHQHR